MSDADILTDLKRQLGVAASITSSDTFFNRLIAQAKKEITRKGINLDCTTYVEHGQLVADYGKWLYDSKSTSSKMPPHLKCALTEILLSQKARGGI